MDVDQRVHASSTMKNLGTKSYLEPLENKTYLAHCPLARIPQEARLQQGRDIIVLVPFGNVPQTLVLSPKEILSLWKGLGHGMLIWSTPFFPRKLR
jgi:hypothetical protein